MRHMGPILLCAWFLLYAPPKSKDDLKANTKAPLVEWSVIKAFDTASDCERMRSGTGDPNWKVLKWETRCIPIFAHSPLLKE